MNIDQNTGMLALATAWGMKDVVVKLLGPTAEFLGGECKEFTQRRVENLKSIFEHAARLSDDDPNKQVPPRVLRDVIEDGSLRDDQIAAEYYGAILAGSRSEVPRDDRGASWTSMLQRLNNYQIRSHYIVYASIHRVVQECAWEGLNPPVIWLPTQVWGESMEFSGDEWSSSPINMMFNIFDGLRREDLITSYQPDLEGEEQGFIINPSIAGVELYMWATGRANLGVEGFLSGENHLPDDLVDAPTGAKVYIQPNDRPYIDD